MSEAKHTPGPWEPRVDRNLVVTFWEVMRPDPMNAGPDDPNRYLICDLGPERSDGTTEANARLIAAAPDLLAALEQIRDGAYDNAHDPKAAARIAAAAIAKAHG